MLESECEEGMQAALFYVLLARYVYWCLTIVKQEVYLSFEFKDMYNCKGCNGPKVF
jgi:hypothetical protein